jgi:hydroxymethylbilane synthase
MTLLRIATRGSKLALWQAEHIRAELIRHDPALQVELLVLKTQGDRILDRALSEIGGKGLFTKEIEEALLDGRADVAVHSMKDLPAHGPAGLVLAAVPPREDPRDALLLTPAISAQLAQAGSSAAAASQLIAALPTGARVGTSSLRRICQLKRLRPDLEILPLRGNVDTRLRKLLAGELDAMVLAAAGLCRLGLGEHISARFALSEMLPACGQGALAVQCRLGETAADAEILARVRQLSDEDTATATTAERAFSLRLGGSCQTPLGAYAHLTSDDSNQPQLQIAGMVGSLDGAQILGAAQTGLANEAAALGEQLADQLLALGARELLK